MSPFNPKFDVKTKATAIAHYQGPKTPRDPEYDNDIGRLHEFLVREKWKGLLTIGYVGTVECRRLCSPKTSLPPRLNNFLDNLK